MLKRATVLLLVVLLASYSVPVSAQTTGDDFANELYTYAATHSDSETRAYAEYRFNQLISDPSNLDPQQTTLSDFISPGVLYSEENTGDYVTSIDLDLDRDFNFSDKYRRCIYFKLKQCLDTYHTELLTATAISTGIFAGCTAISAGSGFVACVAAAYVSYLLLVQAAREKCSSCYDAAPWECRKELGML